MSENYSSDASHSPTPYMHALSIAVGSFVVAGLLFSVISAVAAPESSPSLSREARFLSANQAAMDKMMAGMSAKPNGDVDGDFTAMMIPHHQGAIDMAQAELLYGHNEQLRRIAQQIIVEQQQEIIAMRLALNQSLPPSAAAPDQQSAAP
jgi:Domain of unknown function (DUF305)